MHELDLPMPRGPSTTKLLGADGVQQQPIGSALHVAEPVRLHGTADDEELGRLNDFGHAVGL
jgi:hypothetical protein